MEVSGPSAITIIWLALNTHPELSNITFSYNHFPNGTLPASAAADLQLIFQLLGQRSNHIEFILKVPTLPLGQQIISALLRSYNSHHHDKPKSLWFEMHCYEKLKNKSMLDQQILKAMHLSKVVKDHCSDYQCFFQIKHVFYNDGRKDSVSTESYHHATLGSEQLTIGISPRFAHLETHTAFAMHLALNVSK